DPTRGAAARRRARARRPPGPGLGPGSDDRAGAPDRRRRRARRGRRGLAVRHRRRSPGPGRAGGTARVGGRVGPPVQRRRRPGSGGAAGRRGGTGVNGAGMNGAAGPPPVDLLAGEPRVITAGVSLFAEALAGQAVEAIAVDWRPPADQDPDGSLATALAQVIADPRRPEADRTAVQRMLASRALLVDVRPAAEA